MLPYIYDWNWNKIGMFEQYISFIWTRRYYSTGDFQLTLPITDDIVNLITNGAYIGRPDCDEYGIIEKREFSKIERLEDNEAVVIISGRFLTGFLARRVVDKQTNLSGNAGACINRLINENVINPSNTIRRIDGFGVDNRTSGKYMEQQITGKNLLEAVESICKEKKIGLKGLHNVNGKRFLIQLYEGKDRSYSQRVNPYVIFSAEYDNLESSNYLEDQTATVTDVLVAGEGEGLDRKMVWASAGTNVLNTSYVIANGGTGWAYSSGTMTCTNGGFRIQSGQFIQGQTYTIAFTLKKTSGTMVSVGGDTTDFTENKITINGVQTTNTWSNGVAVNNDTSEQKIVYTFTYNEEATRDFFFRINRGATSNECSWKITNLKLVIGEELNEHTGLGRWEVFQDARNASTNNGAISDTVYKAMLRQEGLESVTGYYKLFAGNVSFNNISLGDDLNLGDIVTIENKQWGMNVDARLVELIESTESSGEYSIIPTFTIE